MKKLKQKNKKVKEVSVITLTNDTKTEVGAVKVEEIKRQISIAKLTLSTGRADLDSMVDKINEIVDVINN